jgi:hypothetical protein
VDAYMRSFDGDRQTRGRGEAFGIRHTISRLFRSLLPRFSAWPHTRRPGSRPAEVVIGTLRQPKLAIAMRATAVWAETTPPPMPVFLERMVVHPLSPYCPRCSLPLEPWQAGSRVEGTAMSEHTTGTRDEHYNVISVLYHVLQGADTCATYLQDAEQAGDQDLAQFFREVQGAYRQLGDRGKTLLRQRLR